MGDESKVHEFLKFHVNILKLVRLWPRKNEANEHPIFTFLQNYFIIIYLIPSSAALTADVVFVMYEHDADMSLIIQPLLASVCTWGQHYMIICFLNNKQGIKKLIDGIGNLQRFTSLEKMIDVDKKAVFLSKIFMLYSTLGALIYSVLPFLSLKECETKRTEAMIARGVPCGMVCREWLPFKYDYTPVFEIMWTHQVMLVFFVSWFISLLTVLLFSIVFQATHHLKVLRGMLLELSDCHGEDMREKVVFCILYHSAIIEFCNDLNSSFGSQMFMHLSLTSVVISILGFELLMVNLFDFVRYGLHLFGWICLLLSVCYTGQILVDESIGVAHDAYATKWYNFPVDVQKDVRMIVMRAQKPIMLKAMNFGVLSLPSFLRVLSSAYSYMTLLFNIKE